MGPVPSSSVDEYPRLRPLCLQAGADGRRFLGVPVGARELLRAGSFMGKEKEPDLFHVMNKILTWDNLYRAWGEASNSWQDLSPFIPLDVDPSAVARALGNKAGGGEYSRVGFAGGALMGANYFFGLYNLTVALDPDEDPYNRAMNGVKVAGTATFELATFLQGAALHGGASYAAAAGVAATAGGILTMGGSVLTVFAVMGAPYSQAADHLEKSAERFYGMGLAAGATLADRGWLTSELIRPQFSLLSFGGLEQFFKEESVKNINQGFERGSALSSDAKAAYIQCAIEQAASEGLYANEGSNPYRDLVVLLGRISEGAERACLEKADAVDAISTFERLGLNPSGQQHADPTPAATNYTPVPPDRPQAPWQADQAPPADYTPVPPDQPQAPDRGPVPDAGTPTVAGTADPPVDFVRVSPDRPPAPLLDPPGWQTPPFGNFVFVPPDSPAAPGAGDNHGGAPPGVDSADARDDGAAATPQPGGGFAQHMMNTHPTPPTHRDAAWVPDHDDQPDADNRQDPNPGVPAMYAADRDPVPVTNFGAHDVQPVHYDYTPPDHDVADDGRPDAQGPVPQDSYHYQPPDHDQPGNGSHDHAHPGHDPVHDQPHPEPVQPVQSVQSVDVQPVNQNQNFQGLQGGAR